MPKVYNKHHGDAPAGAVYVGRPTKWGNQFKIGDPHPLHNGTAGMTRDEVVQLYHYYVFHTPEFIAEIKTALKGKDLVCWCAPAACHADVLLEFANELDNAPDSVVDSI